MNALDFYNHTTASDLKLIRNAPVYAKKLLNVSQIQIDGDALDVRIAQTEIKNAVNESKLQKTSGPDRIVNEALKQLKL